MKIVEKVKSYLTVENIIRLLKQPSTKRAIIVGVGLVGYNVAPEYIEQILEGVATAFVVYEGLRDGDKTAV